jgi:hypothetical protein
MNDKNREAQEWLLGPEINREQSRWDRQIEMNRRADWRSAHMIASKMERCGNNPRNGGDGHGECPYYVDDEDNGRRVADNRERGMR